MAMLGVLAIALFLAVLAAAGVFSSGSKPIATPTTVSATPAAPATTTVAPPVKTPPTLKLPTATVHPNDTGTPVKQLQAALIKLGYLQGKADGIFGPGTKAAVVAFQSASNLTADGIAGAKTLAALKQALLGKTG
ncbi:MAG TPA: peptidoglycan-binding domain-containing protein [Gaiellaceae bacterium]|nr:peptidoglycan-binding domain-containing protein [Gaiellaceae bacterium]